VVCYLDNTIALPVLASYALARRPPRPLKRLYERRGALLDRLTGEYRKARAHRDARAEAAAGTRRA
jgi:deoxyhypusine synthase